MNSEQSKEIVALVSWLQTFPTFGLRLCNENDSESDANRVFGVLGTIEASRAIARIAEEVCESQLEPENQEPANTSEQIWTALLILTSTRARPLPRDPSTPDDKMSAARLKLYVLSNLLDCAVQSPNLRLRRSYIEKIMTLSKSTQKILMTIIERRNKQASRKGSKTTPTKTPPSRSTPKRSLIPRAAPFARRSVQHSPPSASLPRGEEESTIHGYAEAQNDLMQSPQSNASSNTTAVQSNTTSHQQTKLNDETKNGAVAAFTSPSGYTPEADRTLRRKMPENSILSPGVMESPNQIQLMMDDLRTRNDHLLGALESQKKREDEMKAKLDEMEASYRREMMKMEAKAMDREQEVRNQFDEYIHKLEAELQVANEKAAQGEQAFQELQQAQEEVEIMNQTKTALMETTEKLRKYKDKVTELQDVRESLQKEREAHAASVDEVVRLENEVQTLQPLKRQLEDYKIRAIEAEVKLVECQDYLRRMEQQAHDQSAANEYLWRGAVMQQEQLEELQQRIMDETQAQVEHGLGVGDGITELNPRMQEELIRLRNENVQLRSFAAKREADAVERLESSLDDTKRLADRYKEEYLGTKNTLEETKVMLTQALQRENELVDEVRRWQHKFETCEQNLKYMEENLKGCEKSLGETKLLVSQFESRNEQLEDNLNELIERLNKSEQSAALRLDTIQTLTIEREEVISELQAAKKNIDQLTAHTSLSEARLAEVAGKLQKTEAQYDTIHDSLMGARIELGELQKMNKVLEGKIKNLQGRGDMLEQQLEEERQSKHEAVEEAHKSLEATREVLNAKSEKELSDLQNNMNRLLEDERKAYRHYRDEAEQKLSETEEKWQIQYRNLQERSSSSLMQAREDNEQHVEYLKKEHQQQLDQARKESEETQNALIRKGRSMINDAKSLARKELEQLNEKNTALEAKLENLSKEKADLENLLRGKVTSLQKKLEFSTAQVIEKAKENDEIVEKIRTVEREKAKLQDDNDQCRRQLAGRCGTDGQAYSQLESLQKEYYSLLEENRKLKSSARTSNGFLGAIPEVHLNDVSYSSLNRSALSQLRQEYDETIESLQDEKRELLMRYQAATTDVQKAEQRVWEREQEIIRLKEQITSLKLAIQRTEMFSDRANGLYYENRSPKELSFLSAQEDDKSPELRGKSPTDRSIFKRSPSVELKMKAKAEHESLLREKVSLFTASPSKTKAPIQPTSPETILTPTKKHEQEANKQRSSLLARMASDVYGLGVNDSSSSRPSPYKDGYPFKDVSMDRKSLMDHTRLDESFASREGKPECQQS